MTEANQEATPFGGENLEVMRDAHKYNAYLRELVDHYADSPATVLDFGAGLGTFSDSTSAAVSDTHCVEPDAYSQSVLREKGFNTHASIDSVGDASISYAFSLNVLEHIDDDLAAARELFRVLQPGGRLLIYVPAFEVLFTSMDKHVGHVRRYRRSELLKLAEDAGFQVETSAYADFIGFFATLAYRLVDSDEPKPLEGRMVRIYDRFVFPLSRLLSHVFARVLGKNVYVVARKPAT